MTLARLYQAECVELPSWPQVPEKYWRRAAAEFVVLGPEILGHQNGEALGQALHDAEDQPVEPVGGAAPKRRKQKKSHP